MTEQPDLSYPAILEQCGAHMAEGREESRAFLAWFLEHYYRLEGLTAQDCICDGPDDKGIDGIYVDDNLERVDVLQARLIQSPKKTLGDRALRELAGTLDQFTDSGSVDHLAETTGNAELRGLLEAEKVGLKIEEGYEVRGVFVTNGSADKNAQRFASNTNRVALFDRAYLANGYVPVGPSAPVAGKIVLDVTGFDVIEYRTPEARVLVAPLLASELVGLEGIQSGELFDWNVRQSLGRTKVNKAIAQSVNNQAEHKNFLLYHNGLTILTTDLRYEDEQIELSGYSVVNGCQSLTSLFENRERISGDLRLLGRLIELPPDSELAARITRHSNNQNSISARDLQSNSSIQRRLQNEFSVVSSGSVFYEIKRGEVSDAPIVVTNEDAARILLAFDVKQPWSCHQTYRLFDELHAEIFGRPEVTATRIYALVQAHGAVLDVLPQVELATMAKYRLLQFVLLFQLRMVLEGDELGQTLIKAPEAFVNESRGDERLRRAFAGVLGDLVIDLNAEVAERLEEDPSFDYKRELKSPQAVRALSRGVISMYQKAVARKRASSFEEEWQSAQRGLG